MNPEPKLICEQASVKVMRSFDYCHFEICLTMNEEGAFYSTEAVDNLRKEAMRLADKTVEQYKKPSTPPNSAKILLAANGN